MALRSDFTVEAKTPTSPKTSMPDKTGLEMADLNVGVLESRSLLADLEGAYGDRDIAAAAAPEPCRRRVAMLVTHGMGQQVPYETLSAIGQSLITQHQKSGKKKGASPVVNVRRVTLTGGEGAPQVSRAEVCLDDAGGPVDVHVYESYWAPLTEGQISFLQTVAFLYNAAWNGLKACFSRGYGKKKRGRYFDRWVFGDFQQMPIKGATFATLVALLIVISLAIVPPFLFFTPAGLGAVHKIGDFYRAEFLEWHLWIQLLTMAGLAFLAVFAYWVNYFLVEFAGDVAIYVSSYKVSRFDAIRTAILKEASTISRQIYSAGIVDKHELPYDSIVIVGHSLGSVISYDLLNAAINWDQVECNFDYSVVKRTSHLITFGSPLDKTAFLFRTQVGSNRNLREALAARQQPLILDYEKFRPSTFKWINIWAPMDIVSAKLVYYDDPSAAGYNPIENRIDKQATKPLIAHTQYWDNDALHEALYDSVKTEVRAPVV